MCRAGQPRPCPIEGRALRAAGIPKDAAPILGPAPALVGLPGAEGFCPTFGGGPGQGFRKTMAPALGPSRPRPCPPPGQGRP